MYEKVIEVGQLTASDAEAGDYFGTSVAITPDGLVAMVGAYHEDTTAKNAGKVYIYKRATTDDDWIEVNQLTASDTTANDLFGYSVAINSDGLVAMVGAPLKDTTASNAGKVYTYKRDNIDEPWIEVSQLTASGAEAEGYFGSSVAINSNGLIAMVGAYGEDTNDINAGKVYTYKRDSIDDAWTEVNQLTASDAGYNDFFGASLAITSDGLVAMIGAQFEDTAASGAGKVYTYKRVTIDDDWTEVNQLTASDAKIYDRFGRGCSISSDGLTAIVGTWGPSKAYIYERSNIDNDWTEVNIIHRSYNLGNATAIASDAGVILIGANLYSDGMGAVYEYKIQDR